MRRIMVASVVAGLLMALSVPVAGAAPRPNENARPQIVYFGEIEGDIAALFTELCGFPIEVDAEGWFKIIELHTSASGKRQPLQVVVYHLSQGVFTSAWGTFETPLDVGPDVIYIEDGVVKVALTGRSTTGSGVIGRVVLNTETGEVEFEAGKRVFEDFVEAVCSALAPPAS